MKTKIFQMLLALAAAVLPPVTSNASTFGSTSTYSNILWTMSTSVSGFNLCNELRLDGSGDMANSNSFVISGALNCPAIGGAYGAVGSLYMSTDGTFNMNLLLGAGYALQCVRMIGLSGMCVFSNAAGVQLGTGLLSFRP